MSKYYTAPTVDLLHIREALESSWDEKTSYLGVKDDSNPALGQCYPSSWVIQHFFTEAEIIKGEVLNGSKIETHFWNGLLINETLIHIDFTWQQFPFGSSVKNFTILDRNSLNDSEKTIQRCNTLLHRVTTYLELHHPRTT
jgi:hypothetical protein